MVYVQQVKLSCFKSFGGSVEVPLNPGFTVITGPNGSGKSNIIDGILFCLGLASSRGMRAERLPDLINHRMVRQGKAAEASVSVTFSLDDWQPPEVEPDPVASAGPWIHPQQQEVTISRRIRLAPGGAYNSIYSIGAESCSLSQLQVQLRRLRIDPTGSNVVMQGDVTRIVSMGDRERREIIDELAGVALFDQRIEQCRGKLTDVREHEERCHIVESELQSSRQRIERDCEKARRHQQLRHELHQARQQELVLLWETSCRQRKDLVARQGQNQQEQHALLTRQEQLTQARHQKMQRLQEVQEQVKALGESRLLSVQGELAGLQSRERELQRSLQSQDQGDLAQRQHHWRSRCRQLEAAAEALAGVNHATQLEAVEARCADTEGRGLCPQGRQVVANGPRDVVAYQHQPNVRVGREPSYLAERAVGGVRHHARHSGQLKAGHKGPLADRDDLHGAAAEGADLTVCGRDRRGIRSRCPARLRGAGQIALGVMRARIRACRNRGGRGTDSGPGRDHRRAARPRRHCARLG